MTSMTNKTSNRVIYDRSLDNSQIGDPEEDVKVIKDAQEERAKYTYKDWIKRFKISFRDIKNEKKLSPDNNSSEDLI